MPSNQTSNYQFSQWSKTDQVKMEDFNADNAKLDANLKAVDSRVDALSAGKADASEITRLEGAISAAAVKAAEEHVYVGQFQGNGVDNRTIQLPWAPKFVLILGKLFDDPAVGFVISGDFSYIASQIILSEESLYGPRLAGNRLIFQHNKWYNVNGQTTQYILFR